MSTFITNNKVSELVIDYLDLNSRTNPYLETINDNLEVI